MYHLTETETLTILASLLYMYNHYNCTYWKGMKMHVHNESTCERVQIHVHSKYLFINND